MSVHYLNCFTCNARVPAHWRSGALCLLVETDQGLVLVDTGLGQADYIHKPAILYTFHLVSIVPLDPAEAAARQVVRLGYRPEDVRHIVLTHMHFDHCGGLPDFPHATVHVHRREHEAFLRAPRSWIELAYVRRDIAHRPEFVLYDDTGEKWFDFDAIRLPFTPEMWLVPLFGHTRGHCGVAVQTPSGWLLHVADAMSFADDAPAWLERLVLGAHAPRLHAFRAAHPEIQVTTGHMQLDFFQKVSPANRSVSISVSGGG
jgi:glyoxylase-like metal-dependent hydrolase (beta-lactamase superfamily II)